MNTKGTASGALLGAIAGLVLVGCGSAQELSLNSVAASGAAKPPLPIIDTSSLALSASPQSGPVGTVVTLKITGCGDTQGDNHSLSYNAGDLAANTPAGEAAVHTIQTTGTVSTTLTATFAVPTQQPGKSTFYFQCGSAVISQPFTVTP